ncbi:hypothetical protein D3C76_1268400 [compost metagenome]
MLLRDRKYEGFCQQRLGADSVELRCGAHEGDIDIASQERIGLVHHREPAQDHFHIREAFAKGAVNRRQQGIGHMFEEAYGQRANLSAFGTLSLQCRDIRGP